jgi:hypothetical protein
MAPGAAVLLLHWCVREKTRAVRLLLRYIATHSFVVFAWYRIAFGVVVLVTAYSGWVVWQP